MDVVVKCRHCNMSDQFRSYVDEKITRLEKLNDRAIRVEVEVSAERNKRQHDQASRVEITLRTKGPVVRAEAAAEDKLAAFDMALDKLMAQLRKAADRSGCIVVTAHLARCMKRPPNCPWSRAAHPRRTALRYTPLPGWKSVVRARWWYARRCILRCR